MTELTPEEILDAKTIACFNICSHYDSAFTPESPEESLLKMTVNGDLPPWLIELISDEMTTKH